MNTGGQKEITIGQLVLNTHAIPVSLGLTLEITGVRKPQLVARPVDRRVCHHLLIPAKVEKKIWIADV